MSNFLRDFIEMRKSLVPVNHQGNMTLIDPLPKNPSGQKREGKKIKQEMTSKQTTEGDMTMAKIIEEKPDRKEMLRFLQTMANDLTLKKMA
jgi:hypothetical protein